MANVHVFGVHGGVLIFFFFFWQTTLTPLPVLPTPGPEGVLSSGFSQRLRHPKHPDMKLGAAPINGRGGSLELSRPRAHRKCVYADCCRWGFGVHVFLFFVLQIALTLLPVIPEPGPEASAEGLRVIPGVPSSVLRPHKASSHLSNRNQRVRSACSARLLARPDSWPPGPARMTVFTCTLILDSTASSLDLPTLFHCKYCVSSRA